MTRKQMTKWGLLALSALTLGACSTSSQQSQSDDQIKVVTSFYPIYEFTKNVVGDQGQVDLLISAGTEVHDFEPSTKDIAKIQEADAFVYNDDNLETWIDDVEKAVNTDDLTIIKATGDMLLLAGSEEDHDHNEEEGDDHEGHSHALDPHVWLAPNRAINLVETIRDSLVAAFPESARAFNQNAAAYIEKLQELDEEYRTALANPKQTSFVTQHSAFAYLAFEYGLKQVSITGVSADKEPSAKRLAELTSFVKDNGIKVIYFEENASSSVAKTLADEVGVDTAVLNPLEGITEQELAKGADYFSVMRENLAALLLTTETEGQIIETDADKTVYKGYFEDEDIADRSLADWSGDWQSVYPYLLDGSLDGVWEHKAKSGDMTAAEYKDYYTTGYQTEVEQILIDGDKGTMTFVKNGKAQTFTYTYAGYEVLTYSKGNRGVRYLFTTEDADAGEFKYVQFSDHAIAPQDSEHFHLFWGDSSHETLFEEMDNWPTYYATGLTGQEIAQEIVAH